MADENVEIGGGSADVVTEAPQTKVVGKKTKVASTGNLIADIAAEIEHLKKPKALELAAELAEDIETNYFRLGGVLAVIRDNGWYDGKESFAVFVSDSFGFEERKARYLIDIYTQLVSKMIPWDKVKGLGWTKLKDLAAVLTLENVDEWVAKATGLTVKELQALLKQASAGDGTETVKAKDDIVKIGPFKVHADQAETIQSALAKAKGELPTEFDTVALENICAGYLGNAVALPQQDQKTLQEQLAALPWDQALQAFSEAFPDLNIDATVPTDGSPASIKVAA